MKHLVTKDFEKSTAVESIYNPDLMKSFKTGHKYLRKEGGKYIYHESYQKSKGGKMHHHETMELYHSNKADEARDSLTNYLHEMKEGKYTGNSLNTLVENASMHAKKHAQHKAERMKGYTIATPEDKNEIRQMHVEHVQEGITPEKYAEAFEEHENKNKESASKMYKLEQSLVDFLDKHKFSKKEKADHAFIANSIHNYKDYGGVKFSNEQAFDLAKQYNEHISKK